MQINHFSFFFALQPYKRSVHIFYALLLSRHADVYDPMKSKNTVSLKKSMVILLLVGVDAPKSSFTLKACRIWNNLSEKLRVNPNIDTFKSELKILFLKRYQEEEKV